MVGIHLTVGKRAKRMPDTTVETTSLPLRHFALIFSNELVLGSNLKQ